MPCRFRHRAHNFNNIPTVSLAKASSHEDGQLGRCLDLEETINFSSAGTTRLFESLDDCNGGKVTQANVNPRSYTPFDSSGFLRTKLFIVFLYELMSGPKITSY